MASHITTLRSSPKTGNASTIGPLTCLWQNRSMELATQDVRLRQTAFDQVTRLAALRNGVLDATDLAAGFEFDGQRVPLINPQRGIFKPREMASLLSVKTVFPRRGARVWYEDQREAHRQALSRQLYRARIESPYWPRLMPLRRHLATLR
jgi:hypothetical protein